MQSLVTNCPVSSVQCYFRNPDGEARVWCYTMDSAMRWEFCDVPVKDSCDTPTAATEVVPTGAPNTYSAFEIKV